MFITNVSWQSERSRPCCPGVRSAHRRGGVKRPARLPTLSWGVDSDGRARSDTGCAAVSAVRWMVHRASRASIEITMDKQFAHLLQLGRRGAERRFDELVNELSFLFASFPHLSESFDADELPLSFIIKRDACDARAETSRRYRSAQTSVTTRVAPPPKK
jgi:hypothetical protein